MVDYTAEDCFFSEDSKLDIIINDPHDEQRKAKGIEQH